jgi:hypothetical protein
MVVKKILQSKSEGRKEWENLNVAGRKILKRVYR